MRYAKGDQLYLRQDRKGDAFGPVEVLQAGGTYGAHIWATYLVRHVDGDCGFVDEHRLRPITRSGALQAL